MKAVYIHIPFCTNICSYCDFCKVLYNNKYSNHYLACLKQEILLGYQDEKIETIYIGGGTPSVLNIDELNKLFEITKIFKLAPNYEFTFECNIENMNEEKLEVLFKNGVNRLSFGIQTFNPKFLTFLNRHHHQEAVFKIINLAKKIGFKNISIDLIYGIPGQTMNDLENDLELFLRLDITHISTYSLIIEENTKLFIDRVKNIDEDLDNQMYQYLRTKLKANNFIQYEISNFAKNGFKSRHNLGYWNNQEYYGFGLGASGYVNNERYENTKSLTKYLNQEYLNYRYFVSTKEQMENEMILGLRKIEGVNINDFAHKYQKEIKMVFPIDKLIKDGKIVIDGKYLKISDDYLYLSNDVLINFIGE